MSDPAPDSLLGTTGRSVIVTGAGQGIGEAIARTVARAGCVVTVVDRDGAAAQRVAGGVEHDGGQAMALEGDLRDPLAVDQMVAATVAGFGRIDALVNNVGGLGDFDPRPAIDIDPDDWDAVLNLNLRVTFLCCRAVARWMTESATPGSIVNISALGAERASVGLAPYGAAKAAIVQLTRTLALELGRQGIRVNCVAPGRTETQALTRHVSEEARAIAAASVALGRLATPDDVAGVVLALVSDLMGYVTGQLIVVDGGLSAAISRSPHRA